MAAAVWHCTWPDSMDAEAAASRYPVLYSFRRCPYAIRARMALHQAGVAFELREVALRDKPAELIAISPKATVPVLQCADGRVIDESLDIMRWALQHADPDNWLDGADSTEASALLAINEGRFKPALDRYKYAERHPEQSREIYRQLAEAELLDGLELQLHKRSFIGGAKVCWVDVAIFPFVRQFAAVEPEWFEHSRWVRTRRWLQGWFANPAFTGVMMKLPTWAAGQTPMVINGFGRSPDRSA